NESCCSKKKSVIGASSTVAFGGGAPFSRALITSAAARLPPAESPPTAIRVPSPPSVAPSFCIHRNTARQSSRHAGNGHSGARRQLTLTTTIPFSAAILLVLWAGSSAG